MTPERRLMPHSPHHRRLEPVNGLHGREADQWL